MRMHMCSGMLRVRKWHAYQVSRAAEETGLVGVARRPGRKQAGQQRSGQQVLCRIVHRTCKFCVNCTI